MARPFAALTPQLKRGFRLSVILALLAPAAIVFAVTQGSAPIDVLAGWRGWLHADPNQTALIFGLRLTRALNAFAVGGLLALAGALLQVLLRNPLADPYVLGLSGGAAVSALSAMLLGLSGAWIDGAAFAGALLTTVLVFGLARLAPGGAHRLLLVGVVIASGWGAVVGLLVLLSSEQHVYGMLFWLLGDLSAAGEPGFGHLVLVAGFVAAFALARPLNALAFGELQARAWGVAVGSLHAAVYFLASLLIATAVAIAGSIGFVGLIVPHAIRLLAGGDHRQLLFNSALLGGSFLVIADTLARSLISPLQLPAGIVTALVGVPVFLYLLLRTPR